MVTSASSNIGLMITNMCKWIWWSFRLIFSLENGTFPQTKMLRSCQQGFSALFSSSEMNSNPVILMWVRQPFLDF